MPGLGRTQQVLIMMVIWAVTLIAIDLRFNVHPERTTGAGSATKPQIIFGLNHLCCGGCFDNVYQAVKKQSWLTNPMLYTGDALAMDHSAQSATTPSATTPSATTLPVSMQPSMATQDMQPTQNALSLQTQQEAQTVKPHPSPTYYGEVIADMDATQAGVIDLMKIYRDIEVEGLALEKFKVKNIPHFNLHIILPHLCCPTCTSAVGKICDRSQQNPLYDDLKELPSLKKANVELDGLTLEFEDKNPTDLAQVLKVLRRIGYVPKEMHIAVLQ